MDHKLYNILTIEDNNGDYTLVTIYLKEKISNPIFFRAYNFIESVSYLQSDQSFDVILLDLSLPDYSGEMLVRSILDYCKNVPVIILSGNTDVDFSIKSINFGISDYLVKNDLTADALYKSIIYAVERKNINAQLVESEERYSNLFEQSLQPMWVYNPSNYKFIQVNNAAILHYQYSREEFLNMSLFDIRPLEDRLAFENLVSKQKRIDFIKMEFRHQKKDGEIIHVEVYSNPILIKGKQFQSSIIIDNTDKIKNANAVTQAIIKTQENERLEIGGELHDNICQILVGTNLYLNLLKQHVTPKGNDLYTSIENYIELAVLEVRNLSHRLAPAFYDGSSFEESFGQLLSNFRLVLNCVININIDETAKNKIYNRDVQLMLYRILQEQLRNIQKYAKASIIDINLCIKSNFIELVIQDNGQGFIVENVKSGIGLTNIKRRANLFNGVANIISSPGQGCKLFVTIPALLLT